MGCVPTSDKARSKYVMDYVIDSTLYKFRDNIPLYKSHLTREHVYGETTLVELLSCIRGVHV